MHNMRNLINVIESFNYDLNQEWDWDEEPKSGTGGYASFDTPNGQHVEVEMEYLLTSGYYDTMFLVNGATDITGLGEVHEIMVTVLEILDEFCKIVPGALIYFSASGYGRVKLYSRIAEEFSSIRSYTVLKDGNPMHARFMMYPAEMDKRDAYRIMNGSDSMVIDRTDNTGTPDENGQTIYRNTLGQYHREDGPARTWDDGTAVWFKNGEKHRLNGPAIIRPDGSEWWYKDGVRHREDGPAVTWPDGKQEWFHNGRRHRSDGPAVIYADGREDWYKYDTYIETPSVYD